MVFGSQIISHIRDINTAKLHKVVSMELRLTHNHHTPAVVLLRDLFMTRPKTRVWGNALLSHQ